MENNTPCRILYIEGGVSMSKNDRLYNSLRESLNLKGTKKERRRKYKQIISELGIRNITMEDIAKGLGDKEPGFINMMHETDMTLDEAVVLQQYAKAIINQDTRAAEFLRDSVGEKPSQQLDINSTDESGLSKMSYEELIEFRDLLKSKKDLIKKEE